MKIIELRLKTDKGEERRYELRLISDHGVDGDVKAAGGERQLCLSDDSSFQKYRAHGDGLCTKRFMPNITTEGLDYSSIRVGDRISCNDSIIEISAHEKKCFPECPFIQKGELCEIRKNCAFAKIIASGTVQENDEIKLI